MYKVISDADLIIHKNVLNASLNKEGRKEGNVLFNDALNSFYLRLYGIRD